MFTIVVKTPKLALLIAWHVISSRRIDEAKASFCILTDDRGDDGGGEGDHVLFSRDGIMPSPIFESMKCWFILEPTPSGHPLSSYCIESLLLVEDF